MFPCVKISILSGPIASLPLPNPLLLNNPQVMYPILTQFSGLSKVQVVQKFVSVLKTLLEYRSFTYAVPTVYQTWTETCSQPLLPAPYSQPPIPIQIPTPITIPTPTAIPLPTLKLCTTVFLD